MDVNQELNVKTMKIINLLISKIENSEINDSIDFAYYLGEFLFYNQIPFFNTSKIENMLIEKVINYNNLPFEYNIGNNEILFVITEPYLTGGHTRLMENLALMIDENKDLVVTKSMHFEVKNRLNNFFSKINECYREKNENSIVYINRLVDNFLKYDSIVLNIHPEDIYSVIACGIAKKIKKSLKFYFVNHADHAFTYGSTVADFWFEISLYGANIDNLRNIKGKRTFIGIPINKEDSEFSKTVSYSKLFKASNIITAASSIKYKPYKGQSIFLLLETILKSKNNVNINVIGVNLIKNYWWWFIKIRFLNKIKIHKSLPYEKYLEVTKNADCYIDSHPLPGGTAFIEQFLNGIPCIGLKSLFFGYTPLEKLKKENIEDVIDMFNNPPSDKEIKDIQKLVFEVNGFSQVKNRFIRTIREGTIYTNPMANYIKNQDLIFFTNKNIDISVNFMKFLFKCNKSLYIKIMLTLTPLSLIKLFVKYLIFKINRNKF
ncbi:hypothetical protein [Aliarcobacter cryaerophilus]|uniref:hypothetical protein n=1 Tax=Aliarcobacter cryaerophilus TaxID=28198 RepID=UPI00112F081F|nr:hypothetical protein [Aliarcobacter cryaerophilus]